LKKITAIGLLLLLLFNLVGYRLLFHYAQERSDARITARIERAHYDESELRMLRVPLSLPYMTDQSEFERVEGEITLDGHIYKYVKRKVEGGQLVLMVLPDHDKTALEDARTTFFKMANELQEDDAPDPSAPVKSLSFKSFWIEYDEQPAAWCLAPLAAQQRLVYPLSATPLSGTDQPSPEQPPEA
jgi:hypothetical protein